MRHASLALLSLLFASALCGEDAFPGEMEFAQEGGDEGFLYLAWNPGAAFSFFPTDFITRSILPTVAFNQEAGIALAFGYAGEGGSLEARTSVGNSNLYYLVVQCQLGANWFPLESFSLLEKSLYCGGALRYWDLIQVHSGVNTHNAALLADIGWWFDFGAWFIDLRISQPLAIASISSVPHSKPGFAFLFSPLPGISPEMPIGLVQVGVKLEARKD